jgi:hypothetical protein
MANTSAPFAHRINRDGTIDSICKTCFVTVCGQCESESVCAENEAKHDCDPWKLEVIRIVTSKNAKTTLA